MKRKIPPLNGTPLPVVTAVERLVIVELVEPLPRLHEGEPPTKAKRKTLKQVMRIRFPVRIRIQGSRSGYGSRALGPDLRKIFKIPLNEFSR